MKLIKLAKNYYYQVPPSAKNRMMDFYLLEFVYYLAQELPPHKDKENLQESITEALESLVKALKEELLQALLLGINAEFRHVFDQNSKLNVEKFFKDKPGYEYLKKYFLLMQRVNDRNTFDHRPRQIDKKQEEINDLAATSDYARQFAIFLKSGIPDGILVKFAKDAFTGLEWGGLFGGQNWAGICNGWIQLSNAKSLQENVIWIDHIYDLQHNTGSALNKIKAYRGNWVKEALDFKKNAINPWDILKKATPMAQAMSRPVLIGRGIKQEKKETVTSDPPDKIPWGGKYTYFMQSLEVKEIENRDEVHIWVLDEKVSYIYQINKKGEITYAKASEALNEGDFPEQSFEKWYVQDITAFLDEHGFSKEAFNIGGDSQESIKDVKDTQFNKDFGPSMKIPYSQDSQDDSWTPGGDKSKNNAVNLLAQTLNNYGHQKSVKIPLSSDIKYVVDNNASGLLVWMFPDKEGLSGKENAVFVMAHKDKPYGEVIYNISAVEESQYDLQYFENEKAGELYLVCENLETFKQFAIGKFGELSKEVFAEQPQQSPKSEESSESLTDADHNLLKELEEEPYDFPSDRVPLLDDFAYAIMSGLKPDPNPTTLIGHRVLIFRYYSDGKFDKKPLAEYAFFSNGGALKVDKVLYIHEKAVAQAHITLHDLYTAKKIEHLLSQEFCENGYVWEISCDPKDEYLTNEPQVRNTPDSPIILKIRSVDSFGQQYISDIFSINQKTGGMKRLSNHVSHLTESMDFLSVMKLLGKYKVNIGSKNEKQMNLLLKKKYSATFPFKKGRFFAPFYDGAPPTIWVSDFDFDVTKVDPTVLEILLEGKNSDVVAYNNEGLYTSAYSLAYLESLSDDKNPIIKEFALSEIYKYMDNGFKYYPGMIPKSEQKSQSGSKPSEKLDEKSGGTKFLIDNGEKKIEVSDEKLILITNKNYLRSDSIMFWLYAKDYSQAQYVHLNKEENTLLVETQDITPHLENTSEQTKEQVKNGGIPLLKAKDIVRWLTEHGFTQYVFGISPISTDTTDTQTPSNQKTADFVISNGKHKVEISDKDLFIFEKAYTGAEDSFVFWIYSKDYSEQKYRVELTKMINNDGLKPSSPVSDHYFLKIDVMDGWKYSDNPTPFELSSQNDHIQEVKKEIASGELEIITSQDILAWLKNRKLDKYIQMSSQIPSESQSTTPPSETTNVPNEEIKQTPWDDLNGQYEEIFEIDGYKKSLPNLQDGNHDTPPITKAFSTLNWYKVAKEFRI